MKVTVSHGHWHPGSPLIAAIKFAFSLVALPQFFTTGWGTIGRACYPMYLREQRFLFQSKSMIALLNLRLISELPIQIIVYRIGIICMTWDFNYVSSIPISVCEVKFSNLQLTVILQHWENLYDLRLQLWFLYVPISDKKVTFYSLLSDIPIISVIAHVNCSLYFYCTVDSSYSVEHDTGDK
jgi:hypothetical protein